MYVCTYTSVYVARIKYLVCRNTYVCLSVCIYSETLNEQNERTERRVEFAEIGKKISSRQRQKQRQRQQRISTGSQTPDSLSLAHSLYPLALALSINCRRQRRRWQRHRLYFCCCCSEILLLLSTVCQKRYLFTGRRILFYFFQLCFFLFR